ncbi:unnamed protein product [Hydatigera taeniaeformis]|uniref:Copine domain-containing protein n=1 Tax=Hydatigena taeniaeformis TaxID=6205 RepID=A0A158RDR9_HYDTA|nr:unnamed protein product [Hydatigera taeniaeformis]
MFYAGHLSALTTVSFSLLPSPAHHTPPSLLETNGPTLLFSPPNIHTLAQQTDDGSQYYILLILTDGIICDMPQTKAAVVNASRLPVSIIIVGIGAADFSAMEELDGDEIRLTSRGRRADRDIVQFVPFDDFVNLTSVMDTKRQLARAVLAEIPDQLISYMRSRGYKPKNLGRKQSQMSRFSKTATNSSKIETDSSNSYRRSDYCNLQSSSPSAPPHPSI